MMEMKWRAIESGLEYHLVWGDMVYVRIRKMSGMESWTVSSDFGCRMIDAESPGKAMWRATLLVSDECNKRVRLYSRIRDQLPSLHELAQNAGVI